MANFWKSQNIAEKKIMFNLSPSGNLFQACNFIFWSAYLDSFGVKIIQVMPIPMKGLYCNKYRLDLLKLENG